MNVGYYVRMSLNPTATENFMSTVPVYDRYGLPAMLVTLIVSSIVF